MLALFPLHVFLVWIFSWSDFFQVTGTDTSCVLYIICFQFITFEQATLCFAYCTRFAAFLASPYVILLRTCPYLVLGRFDSTVYIRVPTSEFSLSCADLCKVSTEDSDHVISQMALLVAEIEGNCFQIILSILLVWRRSDLFNVSQQVTGYFSLHNQMLLHITIRKLAFTSYCICFCYLMICPVSSAYTLIHWLLALSRSLFWLFVSWLFVSCLVR